MNKILNNKKIITHTLIIASIIFLAVISIQAGFAISIDDTTSGGISGALNDSNPGDTIELAEGTYKGNNNTNMTINKNITIQGKTKDKVILDAQKLSRIYTIGSNLNVTFINITFINGYSTSDGGAILSSSYGSIISFINCTFIDNNGSYGGAMFLRGNITINGSTFKDNFAQYGAGAVYIQHSDTHSLIIDSTFENNQASTSGGGLTLTGANYTASIIDSTFENNKAPNGGGGGLYITTSSNDVTANVEITDSTFKANTANSGGGIYMGTGNNNVAVNVDITDSTFTENTATTAGAFYVTTGSNDVTVDMNIIGSTFEKNSASGAGALSVNVLPNATMDLDIIDSTFTENVATGACGAIALGTGTNCENNILDVTISGSTISGNSAGGGGGGVYINSGPNSNNSNIILDLSDSTISDNSAGGNGGGISIANGDGSSNSNIDVTISDSTISGNSAGRNGGGVYINSGNNTIDNTNNVVISDSTIDDNSAGNNGAGIYNNRTGEGDLTITGSNITNNDGDGIYNGETGTATITGNDISGNGGNGVTNDGDATITDNIISNNGGDGIKNNGNAVIDGNTITGNGGDGIINNGDATVENNIISGNSGNDITNNGNLNGSGNDINVQSTLTINTTVSGNKVTIRVKATNIHNGNVIVGATINFYANGKLIGSAKTNNNGIAEFTYQIPKTGTYNLLADLKQFNTTNTLGTTTYTESNNTTTINVILEKNTIITVSTPTIKEGKKTNIKVTLKDINGIILKNKKISLTINGKTYTATTNNNGIAVFMIAGLKGGKHTVTAKFAGDNNYNPSNVSKVQKVTPKTNLGILSIKKLLTNKKNKRLSTCKITIANTGSLRSKATVLTLFHVRKGVKIKTKYIKIKSIAPGKKISIIVNYFPDKANHRYCKAYFTLDPKNKNKEILMGNNKKSISLKH